MRRRLLQILTVFLSVVGLVAVTVAPASASRTKRDEFAGAASGTVRCSIVVKVKFHPRMTTTSAVAKNFNVRLTNCVAHGPDGQTITGGRVKDKSLSAAASFTDSVLNCTHPAAPSTSTLNILWKGTFTGTIGGIHFSGKAAYFPSSVDFSGETAVTGPHGVVGVSIPGTGGSASTNLSFTHATPNGASATLFTPYTAGQLASMCAGKGLGKLIYTGSITVG